MHADFNKDKIPLGKQRTDQFLLKIVYGNARSLGSHPGKIETLKSAANLEEADIIVISEAGYVEGGVQQIEHYDI